MSIKPCSTTQKTRRSPEQWQSIMLAYTESGLTQESFCARESLAPSTFYKWRQRLANFNPAEQAQPLFVELPSPQKPAQPIDWDIELLLGNQIVLRLRQSM